MNIFSKLVIPSIFVSIMAVTVASQAEMTAWHVKGIHPNGEELIAIKAVDSKGRLHNVKAFFDENNHILDIKVLNDGLDNVKYHVKAVDSGHKKHHAIMAVSDDKKHLDIKAIDKTGKHHDVSAIISDANHLDVKVVAANGEYWPIKIVSPDGKTHDVKAFDFDNDDQYIHVKGLK